MNKAMKTGEPPQARSVDDGALDGAGADGEQRLAVLLRGRVIERLHDGQITKPHKQAPWLAILTGRAYQTCQRWLTPSAPGLPDLASFKSLCQGLDADPNWLLGFIDEKRSLREAVNVPRAALQAPEDGDWMTGVMHEVRHQMYGCRPRRMRGDEMEPEIGDGDTMFVDVAVSEFKGNGIYLITCDGNELIRMLEYRVGVGLILRCANGRYPESVVKDATETRKRRLKVLGRVEGVIRVRKFWRGAASQAG